MLEELKFRDFIQNKFEQRKLGNNSYSLRAFARDLDISVSRLSEILSGNSSISNQTAQKLAVNLKLEKKEQDIFVSLVNLNNSSSKKNKKIANELIAKIKEANQSCLSIESFNLISEWYYFGILSVMELDFFDGSASWISNRLGIDLALTESALETLSRLEFIEGLNGKYKLLNTDGLATTSDIECMALKKSHKQTLVQAIDALESIAVEDRDISSITMAIDTKKIPEAKKLIKKFRRELCVFLESGKKEEVYNLNIQLIPLTNLQKKQQEKSL